MSIDEVLQSLRDNARMLAADGRDTGYLTLIADAIEAAMREPKAYISHTSQGDVLDWEPQFDAPSRTKLFAFPPDAAAEIESANTDAEAYAEIAGKMRDERDEAQSEIEWLREAITEANEAMRDGSDSTAWAILVAALAGKEPPK